MTESLRERCIEGMTDEFRACMAEDELLERIPMRLFDRGLDVLEESAEEWSDSAYMQQGEYGGHFSTDKEVAMLLAVLRGNGE